MQDRREFVLTGSVLLAAWALPGAAMADKASVKIEAPELAKKGSEIKIKVHVHHHGNSVVHYTNWAYIAIDGKEVKRWEFSAFSRPESEEFTREIKYKILKDVVIKAEANCNVHGSAGPATLTIKAE